MPRWNAAGRASQFAAFAALTGYDAMIKNETSRQVNEAGRDVQDEYYDEF